MRASTRQAGLFLALSFIWGTAFVAISAGLADLPPVLFAAIRYDIAGLIMLASVLVLGARWRPHTRGDAITIAVGAVLVIAAYNALLFIGQQEVTSGAAAILIAMNPILATVFARLLLPSERLTTVGLTGLALGFLGVGLVAAPAPDDLLADDAVASAFILLAAVAVSLGSVIKQRVTTTLSTEGVVAWSCVGGAIVLHAISAGLPTESIAQARLTTGSLISVLYLAIFASAIGYFIYFDLLERVGAIEINLVSYAAPLFATSFGWLLLGESITVGTIAGFIAISLGFVLIKRRAIAATLDGAVRLGP